MKTLVLAVAAIAAIISVPPASATSVIINNYQTMTAPSGRFCWGLVGCLIAHAMDEQERQQAQGPHACNVWNGRRYVQATCAP